MISDLGCTREDSPSSSAYMVGGGKGAVWSSNFSTRISEAFKGLLPQC